MPPDLSRPLRRALSVRMRSSSANFSTSSWSGVKASVLSSRGWKPFTSRRSALRRRTAMSRSARSSRLAPRLNLRPSIISISAVNDSE